MRLPLAGKNVRFACFASLMFLSALFTAGCATLPAVNVDRAAWLPSEERLLSAYSGRFSVRIEKPALPAQGAQGRFEWLELASSAKPESRRQILLWIGPLGQPLGRMEHYASAVEERIGIFNSQGRPLTPSEQSAFLEQTFGHGISPQDVMPFALRVMQFFKSSATQLPPQALYENEFPLEGFVVTFRVLPDA